MVTSDLEIRIILYIVLGAIIGIIYSLRKIYTLERKIKDIDIKIETLIEKLVRKKRRR